MSESLLKEKFHASPSWQSLNCADKIIVILISFQIVNHPKLSGTP